MQFFDKRPICNQTLRSLLHIKTLNIGNYSNSDLYKRAVSLYLEVLGNISICLNYG